VADAAEERGNGRSAERAARNEVTFRRANEELDARRRELDVEGERFPLLCECEEEGCTELILVGPAEYREARSSRRQFLVVDGHDPASRVVRRHDGFVIVEKEGREAEIVEEMDS